LDGERSRNIDKRCGTFDCFYTTAYCQRRLSAYASWNPASLLPIREALTTGVTVRGWV